MVLVLESREATKDVDAHFKGDAAGMREAAAVGAKRNLPPDWLVVYCCSRVPFRHESRRRSTGGRGRKVRYLVEGLFDQNDLGSG